MKNCHHLSAIQLRDAFLKGEISAVSIAKAYLSRIEQHDKKLGAFFSCLAPQALMKAEELDKKRAHHQHLGKMAAIPVAVKDNMHIEGELTTCGSKFLSDYKAPFSATAIKRLEEEGA